MTCGKRGKYDEAINYYNKTLVIQQQALSSNHLDLTITYNNIASVKISVYLKNKASLYVKERNDGVLIIYNL